MPERKETTRHHQRAIRQKERIQKIKDHRKLRKTRKENGTPAGIPHTLESLRTADETVVNRDDEDLLAEEAMVRSDWLVGLY